MNEKELLLTEEERQKIRAHVPISDNVTVLDAVIFADEVSEKIAKAQLAKALPLVEAAKREERERIAKELEQSKVESLARLEVIRRLIVKFDPTPDDTFNKVTKELFDKNRPILNGGMSLPASQKEQEVQ